MTEYQRHVNRWKDCKLCTLCEGRQRVVLVRGSLPCDVLFVGEAPGESEDAIGRPFCGQAGQLLDHIMDRAFAAVPRKTFRKALTNLVGCIPRGEKDKLAQPPDASIRACEPRLQEIVGLARPSLVVCVGALAAKWINRNRCQLGLGDVTLLDLVHPAGILRANVAQRGLMVQRAVVSLSNALEELDSNWEGNHAGSKKVFGKFNLH